MAAASYYPRIISSKYEQRGNVKPPTANRGLAFAVRWSNLDLKVYIRQRSERLRQRRSERLAKYPTRIPQADYRQKLHVVKQEHKYEYRQLTNAGIAGLSYLLPKRKKNAMRKQHTITEKTT